MTHHLFMGLNPPEGGARDHVFTGTLKECLAKQELLDSPRLWWQIVDENWHYVTWNYDVFEEDA